MRLLKFLAIPAVLAIAAVALAATKFPSVVLSRAALASYTSTVAASLSTAEVIEIGHFGFYLYSPTSNATADGVNVIEPSDNPASGRWLLQAGVVAGSAIYTVCASSCNFTTIPPLSNFAASALGLGAEIEFNVSSGVYNFTSPIATQPGEYIYLHGAATTGHTITSVVSCSGSSGSYSPVLQMGESVSNITASQDYVLITAAANGTAPTRLDGLMPVTAVNAGSNQITVTDPNRAATCPSGAVTATATDISTVFKFANSDGIDDWNHHTALVMDNIVLVGDGSAHSGFSVQDTDRILVQGPMGAYGFGTDGLYVNYTSEVNGTAPIGFGANSIGIYADTGGQVDETSCWIDGNTNQGILASQIGGVRCSGGVVTGNGGDGVAASTWGAVNASSMASNDNGGYGYDLTGPGYIQSGSASGNTSGSTNTLFPLSPGWTITAANNGAGYAAQILTGNRTCTDNVWEIYNSSAARGTSFDACGDLTIGSTLNVGASGAEIFRDGSNRLVLETFSGYDLQLLGSHGVELGTPTGGTEGSGTVNVQSGYFANGTAGVTSTTCTQWTNGLCTHP